MQRIGDRTPAWRYTASKCVSDDACHLPPQIQIKQAEQQLAQLASQPNYGIAVLRVRTANVVPPRPGSRCLLAPPEARLLLMMTSQHRKELSACIRPCHRQVVAAEGTPAEVRQAAAVNFKNHVKRHWNGTGRDVRSLSDGGATAAPIPDSEKVHIWLMLSMRAHDTRIRNLPAHHAKS